MQPIKHYIVLSVYYVLGTLLRHFLLNLQYMLVYALFIHFIYEADGELKLISHSFFSCDLVCSQKVIKIVLTNTAYQ